MEIIAYILLAIVFLAWLAGMIVGLVVAFPWGLIGLAGIAGIGLLLIKVIKDRLSNQEDDYYSKNVDK